MTIAEVVETKMAFRPNQIDPEGNKLPLGSIEVRIGSHQSNLGQIRTIFCRPASWSRRIPLIGEQVIIFTAPVNDWSTSGVKGVGFLYFSPINSSDDLVLHSFPKLWSRKGLVPGGRSGERKSDKREWGYTFPQTPKRTPNIQPYEGDDLYEGRFGATIRFTSTIKGDLSVYEQKPSWDGSTPNDPLLYLRVKKPSAGNTNSQNALQVNNNKFEVEDLEKDEASLVLTTNQKLKKLKAGFDKNLDAKKLGQFDGKGQAVLNSDRIVLNATKDMAFLIGKEKVVVTGKKIILQTEKYKVDVDELMDFLKKWLGEDTKLATGQMVYSTPSGPTSFSSNQNNYIMLQNTDFTKFKQP